MSPLTIVDIESTHQSRIPRDGYDRPMVVLPEGGKPVPHTRVTTFIDPVEDKSNLAAWDRRQVLIGAAKHQHLLADVLKMDPEDADDKRRLNGLAERLKDLAGANDKREAGTAYHALTELVDDGKALPEDIEDQVLQDMAAYMLATSGLRVVHTERLVVVPELCVAGTPDRVSEYDGKAPDGEDLSGQLVITDLKTGNIEYGMLKIAAQLAIYSRGRFYNHTVFPAVDPTDKKAWAKWKKTEFPEDLARTAYSEMGNVNPRWGIIISLRPGSGEVTLHWADLTVGWDAALQAKSLRELRRSKPLTPFDKVSGIV